MQAIKFGQVDHSSQKVINEVGNESYQNRCKYSFSGESKQDNERQLFYIANMSKTEEETTYDVNVYFPRRIFPGYTKGTKFNFNPESDQLTLSKGRLPRKHRDFINSDLAKEVSKDLKTMKTTVFDKLLPAYNSTKEQVLNYFKPTEA